MANNPNSPRSHRTARPFPSWRPIITEVSTKHGLAPRNVLCGIKSISAVNARYEIFGLLHDRGYSFSEIGRRLGGFDRTTVRHGVQKWVGKMQDRSNG